MAYICAHGARIEGGLRLPNRGIVMNNFLKSAALAAAVFAVYGAVSTASADVVRFTVTGTDWSNIEGPSTGFLASVVEVFDVTDNAGTYSNPV